MISSPPPRRASRNPTAISPSTSMPHWNARRTSRRRASPAHDGQRMIDRVSARSGHSRAWIFVLGVALLIGAWLRLDQVAGQVLIDDEWHAVHQFIAHTPREMFLDFGYADYSIPLGILDWFEAQWWGVSELTLR